MASKHIRSDINLAYPTAEIAVMGAEGAVNIIFRNELNGLKGEDFNKKKASLVENYENNFANPYRAAELGYVDEIINPEITRQRLYQYLKALEHKKISTPDRKHGNIPL
jgi:propionyl-CoA carboxylase beta chain